MRFFYMLLDFGYNSAWMRRYTLRNTHRFTRTCIWCL